MIVDSVIAPPHTVESVLAVEVIDTFDEFVNLEAVWNQLTENAARHPFITHAWVRTWWECFGEGKQLHILVVRDRGCAVAIAPFVRSERRIFGIKLRSIGLPFNDHCPRTDFVLSKDPKAACEAVWSYLRECRDTWDVLDLPQLPCESSALSEMEALARSDGALVGLWRSDDSPVISLVNGFNGWESYHGSLPSKHRSNLRSRLKRLSALGEIRHEVVSSRECLSEALADGFEIEAAGWKGEAGTAIRCHANLLRFYTSLAERALGRGWLRLEFLSVNGRRIAFAYNLLFANTLCTLKVGYDPEFREYSPYNLLFQFMMREAFAEGIEEYDFLGGTDDWKLVWATGRRPHRWLFVFPRTFRSTIVHLVKFRLLPRLKSAVAKLKA